MITDTELRLQGITVLAQALGSVEAERFVALIQREPFDYTKWRQDKWNDLSIEEISSRAKALRKQDSQQGVALDKTSAPLQSRQ
jgi:hypothetical protein